MSRRSAQEYVNAGSCLNGLPKVDAALVAGDISWSKMKILIRVVVRETQSEWLERAEELSTEQLSKDVARCIPGQRPKKPGEGGLPDIYMRVTGKLLLANHEMWELAKRKLSAECGRTLSNEDMMIQLPRMLLCTDADGSIKGRTKVKHSAFQLIIHADAEGTRVHTSQGDVELSPEQADLLMDQADLVPAARPVKNPDGKTPNWLVRRVKARDNNCCQNCGDKSRVQVHHVEFRADGGKTEEDMLASLCDLCHSMVHHNLLNLHGNAKDGFVFLDRSGERVDRPKHYGAALHPEDQVHIVPLPRSDSQKGESEVEM
ncbi:MAG: HNH endonuclease, partial [bacterium]|nr:HNH endonuclease [bacterium]